MQRTGSNRKRIQHIRFVGVGILRRRGHEENMATALRQALIHHRDRKITDKVSDLRLPQWTIVLVDLSRCQGHGFG
jgi:hypothetical protein